MALSCTEKISSHNAHIWFEQNTNRKWFTFQWCSSTRQYCIHIKLILHQIFIFMKCAQVHETTNVNEFNWWIMIKWKVFLTHTKCKEDCVRQCFAQWMAYYGFLNNLWNVPSEIALFLSLFGKWCFNLKLGILLFLTPHVMSTDLARKTYYTLFAQAKAMYIRPGVITFALLGAIYKNWKLFTDSKCAVKRIKLSTRTLAHEHWSKFNWI